MQKKTMHFSKTIETYKFFCLKIKIQWIWKDINKKEKEWQFTLEIRIMM